MEIARDDTINDPRPMREDVHFRLRMLDIGGSITDSKVSRFQDHIPTNLVLASQLWITKEEMVREGIEVNPDSVIDQSVLRGRLELID